jgi:hypothetical protein
MPLYSRVIYSISDGPMLGVVLDLYRMGVCTTLTGFSDIIKALGFVGNICNTKSSVECSTTVNGGRISRDFSYY